VKNGHSNGARRRNAGRLALVTGAASGIGRATALALAESGASLVVVDRDARGVREVADRLGSAFVLAATVDVADREAMRELAADVHGRLGPLDILVNNAGVGHAGGMLNTPLQQWEAVVRVNLWGTIHGCHFFVPKMVEEKRTGHVVNVASVYGLVAAGTAAPYSTTKFAVVGLSEALREELAPHRIGVTAVCPGLIATNIAKGGYYADEAARAQTVQAFTRGHPPEIVARAIVGAIERNEAMVPVGAEAWLVAVGRRVAPSVIARIRKRFEDMGRRP
jgi:short-subunit dehydrogenase